MTEIEAIKLANEFQYLIGKEVSYFKEGFFIKEVYPLSTTGFNNEIDYGVEIYAVHYCNGDTFKTWLHSYCKASGIDFSTPESKSS